MLQLLKGVSYAHKKAAVHRGIKPNNIMFDREGNPKISDWGWEKFMAKTNPTRRKKKSEILAYRAPEQVDPKRFGKSNITTDIFQLGTIFYEMLTGQNPFFSEEPHEITKKITDLEPKPPSKLNDDIPPELDFIVMRAVEKHREDRWESVEEMYRKLRENIGYRDRRIDPGQYRRTKSDTTLELPFRAGVPQYYFEVMDVCSITNTSFGWVGHNSPRIFKFPIIE